uniref:Si:ch211-285c6.1 n=1 Tax=Hucho hucho TaxID=62062 RepID=A0A4W5NEU5_9TELE
MASKAPSSKIQDIISQSNKKSILINQGPPERYQLVTNKQRLDQDNKLRRCTFGERDPTKVNKTVLIVGETGSGKSTLINVMINYVLGVEWEDKVWLEIVEEDKTKEDKISQTESQTKGVTVYEVFGYEGLRVPYSLTIIDTPGYGDTRGIQEDKLIAEKLRELFRSENGIHQIDAVGLVVKSSTNRLTVEQKYIFDAVLSLFGKDMEKNIVALITHSDGLVPTDALQALEDALEVSCAKDDSNQSIYFLFNNSQIKSLTSAKATQAKKEERILKNLWVISAEGMEEFTEFLGRITPQNVKMTEGVLRERKQLEACVGNLQERIEMIDLKQNEIKQTQEALEKHKKEMDENKDFTYPGEEPYKEKVPIESSWWHLSKQATTCSVCKENCHYPGCWWVNKLSSCSVMENEHCTVCTGKCPVDKHVKGNQRYVIKRRPVLKTYEDLKNKYEINEKAAGEKGTLIGRLTSELEQFTLLKAKLVEESYQCVIKLEEKALKTISLSTAQHLDFLIEKMKETGFTEKVHKLEEMKKSAEEHKGVTSYFRTGFN